jgi:Uma2 family endonuclease
MATDRNHHYTLEEYLALERESEVKYEYWDGEIFAMSGGTLAHDQIMGNVFEALRDQLKGRDCRLFTNNMRIKVPAAPPYRYADGSVVCGPVQVERFNGGDLLLNPILLYEVLSPTTEAFDRGDKFTYYKSIPTFQEYLLIAQHRTHVTHYSRRTDGTWGYEEANELGLTIYLGALELTLGLGALYADVRFKKTFESQESH